MISTIKRLAYLVLVGSFGVIASDRAIKGYEVKGGYSLLVWIAFVVSALVAALLAEPVYARLPESLRQAALKLKIEDQRWTTFKHEALILEVKIRVQNRTPHDKQIRGVMFEAAGGGIAAPIPHSDELARELSSKDTRYRMLPGHVDGHDSVYGWYKHAVGRQVDGGAPAYRITVRDELENEYSVSQKARPARRRDLKSLK